MLSHLYYFVGIFFMIKELLWIMGPREQTLKSKKLYDENEQWKKNFDAAPKDVKSRIFRSAFISIMLITWVVLGIFSFQWPLFLLFLMVQLFVIAPLSRINKFSYFYTCLHWTWAIISFFFALFVILNAYHLHIDVWEWIKNLTQWE